MMMRVLGVLGFWGFGVLGSNWARPTRRAWA